MQAIAPRAAEYAPAAHAPHMEAPDHWANRPTAHDVHGAAARLLYVPGVHATHASAVGGTPSSAYKSGRLPLLLLDTHRLHQPWSAAGALATRIGQCRRLCQTCSAHPGQRPVPWTAAPLGMCTVAITYRRVVQTGG